MRQPKILRIRRRALIVAIPNPEKPLGDSKSPISLMSVPFKILKRLIYTSVEPIIDPYSYHRNKRVFDTVGRPWIRSPYWRKTSKIAFRRLKLCLLISQQPTTLHGIATSPASCCNCCLIGTWPASSSWSWLAIAASLLPPATTAPAGYDGSRTAFRRDLSWHPSLHHLHLWLANHHL